VHCHCTRRQPCTNAYSSTCEYQMNAHLSVARIISWLSAIVVIRPQGRP
jgi:hypothetical protein